MITELINQALLKEQEGRVTRVRSGKFSPSSFGRCYRMQVWNRQNEPPTNPMDLTGLKKTTAGNLFDKFVRDLIVKEYPDVKTQVLVEIEDVKGYADTVMSDEVSDTKSVHAWALNYLPKKLEDIRQIKPCEVLQVTFYAKYLNKNFWSLFFISRDDLRVEEYRLPLTEGDKSNVEFELLTLRKYWESNQYLESNLPDASPRAFLNIKTNKYSECQYCPFLNKCIELEHSNGRKHYTDKQEKC